MIKIRAVLFFLSHSWSFIPCGQATSTLLGGPRLSVLRGGHQEVQQSTASHTHTYAHKFDNLEKRRS